MKFLALIFLFSPIAFAEGADPFDPGSCQGPRISTRRALELMGPFPYVNLAKQEPTERAEVSIRYRHILDGETGEWYLAGKMRDLTPYLKIADGKLALNFYVRMSNGANSPVYCDLANDGSVLCNTNASEGWGKNIFVGQLTDHCLFLKSSAGTSSEEREWAYLINF